MTDQEVNERIARWCGWTMKLQPGRYTALEVWVDPKCLCHDTPPDYPSNPIASAALEDAVYAKGMTIDTSSFNTKVSHAMLLVIRDGSDSIVGVQTMTIIENRLSAARMRCLALAVVEVIQSMEAKDA